jgi:hypothetical protein
MEDLRAVVAEIAFVLQLADPEIERDRNNLKQIVGRSGLCVFGFWKLEVNRECEISCAGAEVHASEIVPALVSAEVVDVELVVEDPAFSD